MTIEFIKDCTKSHFVNEMSCIFEKVDVLSKTKLKCSWKEVYHLKLNKIYDYTPGDAIGILTPNSEEIVQNLMYLCNWDNVYVKVNNIGLDSFKYIGSLKELLVNHIDLKSAPRKKELKALLKTAEDKEGLTKLIEDVNEYKKFLLSYPTILTFIEKFKAKPTIEDFLSSCSTITPRFYSLINKKSEHLEVIIGIEKHKDLNTPFGLKYGHCSEFIKTQEIDSLQICFKKSILLSNLNKSINQNTELISFCTGTGITPFISFYKNYTFSKLKLHYGFRNNEDDLSKLFLNELENIIQYKSSDKQYLNNQINIKNIHDNLYIFVCGNMKMQKDVFMIIKRLYPELVKSKRIYFENWK
ncbi:NOS [Hepatospora eriocheir]|uniref:NADPH--hemoprotein reductase n=1 Tax=Hepatospora eriocheir TaxID=1081669 RepID=A0A1X0Q7D8_9MICR|nr:NOS [Hepatospora eriocheir]